MKLIDFSFYKRDSKELYKLAKIENGGKKSSKIIEGIQKRNETIFDEKEVE